MSGFFYVKRSQAAPATAANCNLMYELAQPAIF
jgi:hypothetical protein